MNNNNILVIDDDIDTQLIISDLLRVEGYDVQTAESAAKAFEILKIFTPRLIISDIMMEGVDGFEFCRLIKENPATSEIPVILCTALTEQASIVRGFEAGAIDFITKPFKQKEISARVKIHIRLKKMELELKSKNLELQEIIAQKEVNEKKQLELQKNLMQSNDLLNAVLDAIPDIIGIQKPDHTILRYNKAGYETLGLKPDDVKNKNCYSLLGKKEICENCPSEISLITRKLETFEKFVPELGLHFLCRANPLLDNEGNVKLIIEQLQNITEFKKLQQQLIESEKMSAVGKLTTGVAHEFNNILAIINANAQILELESKSIKNENIKKFAKSILSTVQRGKSIVMNMMSFAKPKKPSKKKYNLCSVYSDIITLQERDLRLENIQIIRKCSINPPEVLIDKYQIEQVLLNIVLNARHAILPKGSGVIESGCSVKNNFLEFFIKDNGIGIAPDKLKNIFEPFYTTKGAYSKNNLGIQGTGLGLSVSRSIIQNHGGSIEVESIEGFETVFRILLPVSENSENTAEK